MNKFILLCIILCYIFAYTKSETVVEDEFDIDLYRAPVDWSNFPDQIMEADPSVILKPSVVTSGEMDVRLEPHQTMFVLFYSKTQEDNNPIEITIETTEEGEEYESSDREDILKNFFDAGATVYNLIPEEIKSRVIWYRVNCDDDIEKCEYLHIYEYPRMMFFSKEGQNTALYQNSFDTYAMVESMTYYLEADVQPLHTVELIEFFSKPDGIRHEYYQNSFRIIGAFAEKKNEAQITFEAVATSFKSFLHFEAEFGMCPGGNAKESEQDAKEYCGMGDDDHIAIVSFKSGENNTMELLERVYPGDMHSQDELLAFILSIVVPPFTYVSSKHVDVVSRYDFPVFQVITSSDGSQDDAIIEIFKEIGDSFHPMLHFLIMHDDVLAHYETDLLTQYDIEGGTPACVISKSFRSHVHYHSHFPSGDISQHTFENYRHFVRLWKHGKIEFEPKSEGKDKLNTKKGVTSLTGNTFIDYMDESQESVVLILFYKSKKCSQCDRLFNFINEIGKKYQHNNYIKIAMIDCSLNDPPEYVKVSFFPELLLFPPNQVASSQEFPGIKVDGSGGLRRLQRDFKRFALKHAHDEL